MSIYSWAKNTEVSYVKLGPSERFKRSLFNVWMWESFSINTAWRSTYDQYSVPRSSVCNIPIIILVRCLLGIWIIRFWADVLEPVIYKLSCSLCAISWKNGDLASSSPWSVHTVLCALSLLNLLSTLCTILSGRDLDEVKNSQIYCVALSMLMRHELNPSVLVRVGPYSCSIFIGCLVQNQSSCENIGSLRQV